MHIRPKLPPAARLGTKKCSLSGHLLLGQLLQYLSHPCPILPALHDMPDVAPGLPLH